MAHPMLDDFLRPQGGENGFWRWFGGMALILFFWMILGGIPLAVGYILLSDKSVLDALSDNAALFEFMATPLGFLLTMSSFLFFALGIYISQKGILDRPFCAIITAHKGIRWRKIFGGMLGCTIAFGGYYGVSYMLDPSAFEFNFNPATFWVFLSIALVLTFIQSGTEELFFRGYLNQWVGHYLSSPWFIFVISSSLFAVFHLVNPGAMDAPVFYLLSLFAMGMAMSILLYFEGGLESAIGFHTANNLCIFTLVGYRADGLPAQSVFLIESAEPSLLSTLGQVAYILTAVSLILFINRKFDKTVRDDFLVG